MRSVSPFVLALFWICIGCGSADEPPACDFEDEATCTCDDGTMGELVCENDLAHCICDDAEAGD